MIFVSDKAKEKVSLMEESPLQINPIFSCGFP